MPRNITVLEGHPDPDPAHFGYALADAYIDAAQEAGHEVRRIRVSELDFTVLRTRAEWLAAPPPDIQAAQDAILWADHLVLFYPLWLSTMPALLNAFWEQVFRPGFGTKDGKKLLTGRSARVIVTMGMPAKFYHPPERNLLGFTGIGPIEETPIGEVDGDASKREAWLSEMAALGRAAA